ncbi:MAG: LAGLIDADG family homing endonuclease [Candidatus Paceibacterota bacterium]
MHTAKIPRGRVGGLARVRVHGNPGTTAGRRLGGLNSLKTHNLRKTGFKVLRSLKNPPNSSELAELLGILAGDGHLGEYQATVTTNSDTDREHAEYIKALCEKLFSIPVRISYRKKQKACVVVVSSKEVCRFLARKGMAQDHKIRSGMHMPPWIQARKVFRLAFIRGLFDTDGSVYVDTHQIKGRTYKNIAMMFSNRCIPLLSDFKSALESIGLHPTQKTQYAVFLRRKKEIQRYFELIGSSNLKHKRKIQAHFLF